MQITPHFSLAEMTHSNTGSRLGIENVPDAEIVKNLKRICELCLEPARAALGPIIVSSGYRSPALNKAVGGSTTSAHRFGLAADINATKVSNAELAAWLSKHVPFDQIILEFPVKGQPWAGWVHIGLATNLRSQRLTAKKVAGKTVYMPGFVL